MAKSTQTGIRFPEDVLAKLKFIAWHDRRTITNTVVIACEEYIKDFEKKNGEISVNKPKDPRVKEFIKKKLG